jgi:hypothetical protein
MSPGAGRAVRLLAPVPPVLTTCADVTGADHLDRHQAGVESGSRDLPMVPSVLGGQAVSPADTAR